MRFILKVTGRFGKNSACSKSTANHPSLLPDQQQPKTGGAGQNTEKFSRIKTLENALKTFKNIDIYSVNFLVDNSVCQQRCSTKVICIASQNIASKTLLYKLHSTMKGLFCSLYIHQSRYICMYIYEVLNNNIHAYTYICIQCIQDTAYINTT